MIFTTQKIQTIIPMLQKSLQQKTSVTFSILNPDIKSNIYSGETININNVSYRYRGYKSWISLAEILQCRMLTPKKCEYPHIQLTFEKLNEDSFHNIPSCTEKYGTNSLFFKINKMEEASFFYYYDQALDNVNIQNKKRILNLGINRGDEFEVIKNKMDFSKYKNIDLVGIDYSYTAVEYAKQIFPEKNVILYQHDINQIDKLSLGYFDLIISIGTFQSQSINFKPFFMKLVQSYLNKKGDIIIGFPNSRWIGGEMIYGAKVPNYSFSELGHLYSDVIFCKKYLQQKKYRVVITGKEYIFLTAIKIK